MKYCPFQSTHLRHLLTASCLSTIFLFSLTASISFAQELSPAERSLRGLAAVCVSVDKMPGALSEAGISSQSVRADIEARLKHAGIKVIAPEDFGKDRNAGKLSFHVSVMPGEPMLSYFVNVDLYQQVVLSRAEDTAPVPASTWQKTSAGMVGRSMLDLVRASLTERADSFINDFAQANAAPASPPEQ